MLDTETKRRIDTARDILVGKVPNPASQVEQITIALIYKFMDDMDKEVEELGGKPSFFRGDYAKYSWSKIFDPKLSGFEIVALYGEALDNMNLNPDIPPLFREIFKNAFLPYRDPETLKSFLKIINEFHYTHSEKLGDAYEYLLSIMSSQGDAGQFRTPRHIIDFIVDIVNPQKTDKILDPACGTAGFLISSYKHILKSNTKKSKGDMLTPEDKNKLTENLTGYDISPDMVRISLVNMYLHGFSNPKIFEYDTLTSEDRWNEYYDVILANPPFMSPKGGIRPHKRFSIQAKRSEVLFVDYIAEHLTPSGKAGVIVPEGIIFQSGNAYKNLRKMLVENYLWAVVSLPAGIFNPYSGVKTSVLLFDKALAKSNGNILFVKVENDGYDLGAQRRKINKDDLPAAKVLLKEYIKGKTDDTNHKDINYLIVPKQKISENGDYNLSMDRYKENGEKYSGKYKTYSITELIDDVKYTTKINKSIVLKSGEFPVIDQSENFINGFWNNPNDVFRITKPVIVFGDHTRIFKYIDFNFVLGADGVKLFQPKDNVHPKYFYYCLKNLKINNLGYSRHFKVLKELKIPLPPLEIQQEIVNKIESYQKIIDGAKQIIENYKPEIDINPDWEIVDLGKEVIIRTGKLNANAAITNGKYPFFTCSKDIFKINRYSFDCEAVLLSGNNASGDFDVKYYNGKFDVYQRTYVITIKDKSKLNYFFLKQFLFSKLKELKDKSIGGLTRYLTLPMITSLQIPIPNIQVQRQIVDRIESEQKLIEANKELVKIYEQKIKDEINKVWDG